MLTSCLIDCYAGEVGTQWNFHSMISIWAFTTRSRKDTEMAPHAAVESPWWSPWPSDPPYVYLVPHGFPWYWLTLPAKGSHCSSDNPLARCCSNSLVMKRTPRVLLDSQCQTGRRDMSSMWDPFFLFNKISRTSFQQPRIDVRGTWP